MIAWTRNRDIKKRLEKMWNRGKILAQCVDDQPFEPLRIPLKHPTAKALAHEFEEARTWVAHLVQHAEKKGKPAFDIEWHEFKHRTLGRNKLPRAIIFQTLDQILVYLGKTEPARQYQLRFKEITAQFPELSDLLAQSPLDVLTHDRVWDELLAIVSYIRKNPCPGIYLRQLEIPGVDTKFIENHKSWLIKLLTNVLPRNAVTENATGPAAFENRFGFRSKPARIRFRTLDPDLHIMGLSDLEIPASDFHHLPVEPEIVFIVENDITGLAFPDFPGALVVFGLGYSLSSLASAAWMAGKTIWYWGDLDTHGFAMLDQVRHYCPQTGSFLMDEATLLSHKPLWGREPSPVNRDLPLLTPAETRVYDALRHNRHAPNLRLEQERISFSRVRQAIDHIQRSNPNKNGG
jgi:hypothetical protein